MVNLFNDISELPLAMTVAEVSIVLRIGRSKAYQLIRSKKLRSIRIGRSIRVPRDALLEYLRTN